MGRREPPIILKKDSGNKNHVRFRVPKIVCENGKYFARVTEFDGIRRKKFLGYKKSESKRNLDDYLKKQWDVKNNFLNSKMSIDDGIEYFLEYKRTRVRKRTLEKYIADVKSFKIYLAFVYPKIKFLAQVTPEIVEAFMRYLESKKLSFETINSRRDRIYSVYQLLKRHRKIQINPAEAVDPIRFDAIEAEPLSSDEVRKILNCALQLERERGISWHAIFATLYYTGMRRDELRYLMWDDVRFDLGNILIRSKEINGVLVFSPKNHEAREIPIHVELLPILRSLPRRSRWVFSNQKGSGVLGKDRIWAKFQVLCDKVKIKRRKAHILRHTWASHSIMAGVHPDVVQKIGGWRDRKVMDKYRHLSKDFIVKQFVNRPLLKT